MDTLFFLLINRSIAKCVLMVESDWQSNIRMCLPACLPCLLPGNSGGYLRRLKRVLVNMSAFSHYAYRPPEGDDEEATCRAGAGGVSKQQGDLLSPLLQKTSFSIPINRWIAVWSVRRKRP